MTGHEPPPYEQQPLVSYPPMYGGGFRHPMPRPVSVAVAFRLVLLGIGIVLLMLVLSLVIDYDDLRRSAAEELAKDGPYTDSDLRTFTQILAGLISATVAVAAGLFLLFGLLMRSGRNWARVVLTVLLSFGLLVSLVLTIAPVGMVIRMLCIPLIVVSVATIVAMFARGAGPYFDPRARMES